MEGWKGRRKREVFKTKKTTYKTNKDRVLVLRRDWGGMWGGFRYTHLVVHHEFTIKRVLMKD